MLEIRSIFYLSQIVRAVQNVVPCTTQGRKRKDWKLSAESRSKSRSIRNLERNTWWCTVTWHGSGTHNGEGSTVPGTGWAFKKVLLTNEWKNNTQAKVFRYSYFLEDILTTLMYFLEASSSYFRSANTHTHTLWVQWKKLRTKIQSVVHSPFYLSGDH